MDRIGMSHRVLSPAKINLFLKILKKREDGYHDIVSIMQPISLYDKITLKIEKGKGISVECNNKSIPSDKTNLAYMAAEVFLRTTGIKRNLSIKIKKNIPVAAGLGGGSSNAAAVLKALNEITSVCLPHEKLMEMAAGLGSDVPFFILGKPCLARGRGEILEPVNLLQFRYILINPGFPVSTQWAYQNSNLTKMEEDISIIIAKVSAACLAGRWDNPAALQGILINDLEEATIRKHPEIQEIKKVLIDFGAAGALMSGSGPTVFGVFFDEAGARKAFEQIKKDTRFKRMTVFMAQGL